MVAAQVVVAQAAAAVAAPAVVAAEGVSGAAIRAKDYVVESLESAAVAAASTAADNVGTVAQQAVQRRIARALGTF